MATVQVATVVWSSLWGAETWCHTSTWEYWSEKRYRHGKDPETRRHDFSRMVEGKI